MKKTVIVINGSGGVGKDTMCDFAAECYSVKVISAITPVKKIARLCGWNGEKDEKSRRFLSEFKDLLIRFNDLPNRYLLKKTGKFAADQKHEVLFVHIREIPEIEKYISGVRECFQGQELRIATLLVTRKGSQKWNNASDDKVFDYNYDFVYRNDKPLADACSDFTSFFREALNNVWNEGTRLTEPSRDAGGC